MKNRTIKAVIADDHFIYREGVKSVLAGTNDIEVIGEAENGLQVVQLCRELAPDVVLTDLKMPYMSGVEAVRSVLQSQSFIAFIALTMVESEEQITEMIEAGAMGYLVKSADKNEIIKAIRFAYEGKAFYCNSPVAAFGQMLLSTAKKQEKHINFSARELEIIALMSKQLTSEQIAKQLYLAKKTVDGHRYNIMQKIGCNNTIGIV